MPPFRYIAAFGFACLIVIGGIVFCITTNRALAEATQQQVREAEAAGKIPPGSESRIKDGKTTDMDLELPDDLILRLDISEFLSNFKLILIPGVFVVCLGIAALVGRFSQNLNQ